VVRPLPRPTSSPRRRCGSSCSVRRTCAPCPTWWPGLDGARWRHPWQSAGGLDDAVALAPEATAAPETTAVAAPAAPAPSTPAVAAPATPAPTTATPVPGRPGPRPPAEGVYQYRTAGGESVSLLSAHHDYPADTYAVVRHTGGCGWHIRAEVVREHVDERTMCSEAGRLLQHAQSREVEFFSTRDGGEYRCDPPQVQHAVGDRRGATSVVDCTDGKGSFARLVRTTLGSEQLVVGGVPVEVLRLRVDGTLTGRYRGTSVDLLAIDAATGLPLVWERSVDTQADAFGSSIRYQEQARFDLVSLTPAT
jgi:hypothetical protein